MNEPTIPGYYNALRFGSWEPVWWNGENWDLKGVKEWKQLDEVEPEVGGLYRVRLRYGDEGLALYTTEGWSVKGVIGYRAVEPSELGRIYSVMFSSKGEY